MYRGPPGAPSYKQQLPIEWELVKAIESCRNMRTQAAAGTVSWEGYFEAVYALYDEIPPDVRKLINDSQEMADVIESMPLSEIKRLALLPRYRRSLIMEQVKWVWQKRAVDGFFRKINQELYSAGLLLKSKNTSWGLEGDPQPGEGEGEIPEKDGSAGGADV